MQYVLCICILLCSVFVAFVTRNFALQGAKLFEMLIGRLGNAQFDSVNDSLYLS